MQGVLVQLLVLVLACLHVSAALLVMLLVGRCNRRGFRQITIVHQEGIRSAAGFMRRRAGAHYHNCRPRALLGYNEDLPGPWHKAKVVSWLALADTLDIAADLV